MAGLADGKWFDTDAQGHEVPVGTFKSPTRAEYMGGKVTHQEYYRAIAAEAGISYDNFPGLSLLVDALKQGDEHFNRVHSIQWWDGQAAMTKERISKALKAHGDYWSLACGLCTYKAAAKKSAEAHLKSDTPSS